MQIVNIHAAKTRLSALTELETLDPAAAAVLAERKNEIYFSTASIWEIAIKRGLQKPEFEVDADAVVEEAAAAGFMELAVTSDIASRIGDVQIHHSDPFDRLLLTQAILGSYQFYTSDRKLPVYSPLVKLVGSPRPSV